MITGWVGGVQKGQNIDYVIYGRSLIHLESKQTALIVIYAINFLLEGQIIS